MRQPSRPALLRLLALAALIASPALLAQEAEEAPTESHTADLAFGLTGTRGNTDTLLMTLGINANVKREHYAVESGAEAAFGQTDVELPDGSTDRQTNTQRAKAFANYKRRLQQWHAYGDGTFAHDEIADVQYRTILGLGVGRYLIDRDELDLYLELGAGYLWEEVADEPDHAPTLRVAQRAEWALSPTAKLWQSTEWVPRADDLQDYLFAFDIGLDVMVNSHLSLRVTLNDHYDSTPAPDKERNDITLISALAVKL